jgi:uncharacterized membrane protein
MQGRARTIVIVRIVAVLGLACAGTLASPAAAQDYVVKDLPLISSFGGRVFDINDAGMAVGHGLSPSLQLHALRWPGTGVTDLTPTNALAEASGIAENGVIAGWFRNAAGATEAVRWTAGVPTPLGWLPGHIGSFAQDGNAAGLVTGWSVTTVGDPVAVVWNGGAPQAIGGTFTWAFACSETGDVVGRAWVGVDVQAFRWRAGVVTVLPDLGPNHASAVGISPAGRIAGNAESPDGKLHGILWDTDLAVTDLGIFDGFFSTAATDVNDAGVAVGGALDLEGEVFRALVWRGAGAEDLNDLIQPGTTWVLRDAQAINARGEIVGIGLKGGFSGERPFLLQPDCDGDGLADLAEIAAGTAYDSNLDGQSDACQHCQADLGFGGPGAMQLSICGDELTAPGTAATLALEQAPPGEPVLIVAGFVNQPTPIKSGTLVPVPPTIVLPPLTAGANGALAFPIGGLGLTVVDVYLQAVALLPAQAQFSNAVHLVLGVP